MEEVHGYNPADKEKVVPAEAHNRLEVVAVVARSCNVDGDLGRKNCVEVAGHIAHAEHVASACMQEQPVEMVRRCNRATDGEIRWCFRVFLAQ